MIYRFKLVSDEVGNFFRVIEIDSEASFLDLRNVILDSVGYTKDEMNSFFICDEDWERHEEVTLEDMGSASDRDIWIMEDTPLNELIEDEGQRVSFVFDYLTERSFFMELKEIIPGRNLKDPVCTTALGKAPAQDVDIDAFERDIDAKAASEASSVFDELNLDEMGDGYNDEDISALNENIEI